MPFLKNLYGSNYNETTINQKRTKYRKIECNEDEIEYKEPYKRKRTKMRGKII